MQSKSKPPIGVKIIALIVLFYSLIFILSAASAFSMFVSLFVLFGVFAIIGSILGIGLWKGKAIPKVITLFLSGILLISFFSVLIRDFSEIKVILTAPAPFNIIIPTLFLIFFVLFPLVIIIYLSVSKKAKE